MADEQDIAEMLLRNSIPEPNSGCWLWLRGAKGGGRGGRYAVYLWQGRQRLVSHLALLTRGIEVPPKFDACHHCDVTLCVNPDHLFVGTRLDNMRDAKAKGRMRGPPISLVCPSGHELSGDNLHISSNGKRRCKACMEISWRKSDAAEKIARHERGLKRYDARWGNVRR